MEFLQPNLIQTFAKLRCCKNKSTKNSFSQKIECSNFSMNYMRKSNQNGIRRIPTFQTLA